MSYVTYDKFKIRVGSAVYKWFKKHPKLFAQLKKFRAPESLKTKALTLARKEIGTKESPAGSNRQKFGEWYGANGEPWCAIFESWVLTHAGRPFHEAYVPDIVNKARARQEGLSTVPFSGVAAELKAGNVVLAAYDWPGLSPGIADHTGFVEKIVNSNSFQAIEGNTSSSVSGNQSNGGEVCRKVRDISDVQAFIVVKKVS